MTADAAAQQEPAVATRALTKRYRNGTVAVDAVDLLVPTGSVYGFLGPNGSGKSTTIRMLLGLTTPSAGWVRVLGQAMPEQATAVLPRVGSVVDGPGFHPYLSGRQNLRRFDAADRSAPAATRRLRVEAALERLDLGRAARMPVRAYSTGMRQRLALAAALLVPRRLLVLDEPTNGLDAQGVRELRRLVAEVAAAGATVLLSSHALTEVERVCTHVGVLSRGRLLGQGTLAQVMAAAPRRVRVAAGASAVDVAGVLERCGVAVEVTPRGVEGVVAGAVEPVVAGLRAAGVEDAAVSVGEPSLEDAYVALTGEGFGVAE